LPEVGRRLQRHYGFLQGIELPLPDYRHGDCLVLAEEMLALEPARRSASRHGHMPQCSLALDPFQFALSSNSPSKIKAPARSLEIANAIERYVTSLHRSIPHPQPLSRRAREASSKTGPSPGSVMVNNGSADGNHRQAACQRKNA